MVNRLKIAAPALHAEIAGPIVIIGMGSIGKGVLPLIERHIGFDRDRMTVIDPSPEVAAFLDGSSYNLIARALTQENYTDILGNLFSDPGGFCVNLSVDTSSLDLMRFCREIGALYIDTVVEPWPGFYFGNQSNEKRTNYRLRQAVRDLKTAQSGGTTAVSCCGANPGMVSWLAKEALLELAVAVDHKAQMPTDRESWATLMRDLGVKGIHIAERDTQVCDQPRAQGVFVNTWSVEGFLAEGFQPSELGWGTHETWFPSDGKRHITGCQAAIWLNRAGAETRVRTWCPSFGAQFGYLITHNEAISLADYFTVGRPDAPEYRPTCHYAYHPCDDAVLSLHETFGSGKIQADHTILKADDIRGGIDELGVLLYGHEKNAMWHGSRLSNTEARRLAPNQNATGLQVTSAVLAGIVWALENPKAGIVEAEEMNHVRCLEIQRPYLGSIETHFTNWTPLDADSGYFPTDSDPTNPWSFRNVLV